MLHDVAPPNWDTSSTYPTDIDVPPANWDTSSSYPTDIDVTTPKWDTVAHILQTYIHGHTPPNWDSSSSFTTYIHTYIHTFTANRDGHRTSSLVKQWKRGIVVKARARGRSKKVSSLCTVIIYYSVDWTVIKDPVSSSGCNTYAVKRWNPGEGTLCVHPHLKHTSLKSLFQIKSLSAWEEVCGISLFQLISNPVAVVLFLCLVLFLIWILGESAVCLPQPNVKIKIKAALSLLCVLDLASLSSSSIADVKA